MHLLSFPLLLQYKRTVVLFVEEVLNGSMPCVYIFIQLFFC